MCELTEYWRTSERNWEGNRSLDRETDLLGQEEIRRMQGQEKEEIWDAQI
jgi:hypothetical protein